MAVFFGNFTSALFVSDVFGVNNTASSDTYQRILSEYDGNRWYASSDVISCDSAEKGFSITSPIVTDDDLYNADVYRLFLSPYRVRQLKNGSTDVDISKVIMKEFEITGESDKMQLDIPSDWLDKSQIYYGFILPINEYDEIGTPSNEFCFQLENNMCVWDEACDSLSLVINPVITETADVSTEVVTEEHWSAIDEEIEEDEQHNAACIGMDLANVSHTISDDTITLTWTSLWDGSTVQIAIFDPDEEIYKALWTARMNDEKFEYKMKWDGEQNFSLTNGCREVYYKADASRTPSKLQVVTPATWPAENVLYVAIAAIILYGAYVMFFRKADNK